MTVTIFVEPNSFLHLISTLKILEPLPLDNDYVFTPSDMVFSQAMIPNYIWLNIPLETYSKFMYCYLKLKNK